MNRYKNIFTGSKVTKLSEHKESELINNNIFVQTYVLYRKDIPQVVDWGRGNKYTMKEYYEFTKPLYVFEQTFKEIKS